MNSCDTCPHKPVSQSKPCPDCGGLLISLSGSDELLCESCKTTFEWPLSKGQESVLVEGKVGGRP